MKRLFWFLIFSSVFSGCVSIRAGGEVQSGRLALINGQPEVALAHFQRAAELEPEYIADFAPLRQGVWTYVGRAYYAMGKFPEARQALDGAVSRSEDDFLARLYLGLTLMRQQKQPKPENLLSLQDVAYALKQGVLPKRLATIVQERGVGFDLTKEAERELKKAGANDPLIEQIKRTRADYLRKRAAAESVQEPGVREVDRALRDGHNWLEYVTANTEYGRFWDPGREIRKQIQSSLAMIAKRKVDRQKLIANGEWVGKELEEEIDRARRDERQQRAIQPR
ncbi:MAG: tetratricopeptide repeat protein [Deltaproteobacteria bacterium]|nr:tetratricopeptide repeat protein [Deltaproteobacteria bacterium]